MDSEAEFRHILAISLHSCLFFLTAYVLMTLSDLESDYINSRECCDRLNFWTKPRLAGLIFLCLLPASGPTWLPAMLAFPFMAWYFRRLWKVPIGIFFKSIINCVYFLKLDIFPYSCVPNM